MAKASSNQLGNIFLLSARKNTADFGTYFQKWRRSVSGIQKSTREDYFSANSAFSIHPLCLIIDSFVQNADFRLSGETGERVPRVEV